MRSRYGVFAALALTLVVTVCSAEDQTRGASALIVKKLGDRLLSISDGGMGEQLAVRSRKGIIVFGTLWSAEAAKTFRSRVQAEFGVEEMAAVVLGTPRLDYAGGGASYTGVETYAHARCARMLSRFQSNLPAMLRPLIEMWRWKEGLSRDRLAAGGQDPERAKAEKLWMESCRRLAEDLSSGYDLRLPSVTFDDRLTVDLGDMRLELIYLGAVSDGWPGIVARIRELGLVVFGPLSFHVQHLLPYQNCEYWQDLQLPRAISVLDEILADEAGLSTIVVGSGVWPVSELRTRRRYMGELLAGVREACARGVSLEEIRAELSVDARFPYLKELEVWRTQGAAWCLEEHEDNVVRFWGQCQRFAAREVFQASMDSGTDGAMSRYGDAQALGNGGLIFDVASMDSLVDYLFKEGDLQTAFAVVQRNVEAFPDSAAAHARLGEALLLQGDRDNALAACRRALALDPRNRKALEIARSLGG